MVFSSVFFKNTIVKVSFIQKNPFSSFFRASIPLYIVYLNSWWKIHSFKKLFIFERKLTKELNENKIKYY